MNRKCEICHCDDLSTAVVSSTVGDNSDDFGDGDTGDE